jgi:signal transduction histidine kinase
MQMRGFISTARDAAPWLGLTAVIGILDYNTPATYGFASIYFIPIFPAAWRSRTVGFLVAAVATFAWIYCDAAQRPVSDIPAQLFNYATRMVVFVLAVVLASTLQREQHRIGALDSQRRSLLTLLEHEVPGPLRELATELRDLSGVAPELAERLTKRAEQLVFLSDDLASLGELEAAGLHLTKRSTNVVDMIHELRAGASDRQHIVLTVPVAPVHVQADPDRLRQALDAMFREVSATADSVSVDCRTEKGSVAISIGSASMTMPSSAATLVRGDDPALGARTQLARVLVAAHGGTLFGARESMGRGQRLIARLPI